MDDTPTPKRPRRLLLEPELHDYDGLKATQRNELIKDGKYPPPVRTSERRKGWIEEEIAEWQAARIAARDRGDAPVYDPLREHRERVRKSNKRV